MWHMYVRMLKHVFCARIYVQIRYNLKCRRLLSALDARILMFLFYCILYIILF